MGDPPAIFFQSMRYWRRWTGPRKLGDRLCGLIRFRGGGPIEAWFEGESFFVVCFFSAPSFFVDFLLTRINFSRNGGIYGQQIQKSNRAAAATTVNRHRQGGVAIASRKNPAPFLSYRGLRFGVQLDFAQR